MNWSDPSVLAPVLVILVFVGLLKARGAPTSAVASLATSLGILGTFVGILLALMGFDARDVAASVPALLDGMSLAFVSSVVGLSVAVLLRAWDAARPADQVEAERPKTADDIYAAIADQSTQLFNLTRAIQGEQDASLVSQLQGLRTATRDQTTAVTREIRDQSEVIGAKLDEFARALADANTDALVEALKTLIEDFNAKINEELGESFRQFAVAVDDLRKWQSEYHAQLVAAVEGVEKVGAGVKDIDERLGAVAGHTEKLFASGEKLGQAMSHLERQLGDLDQRLKAFADLSESAKDAFPTIKKNLDELTAGMKAEVTSVVSEVSTATADLEKATTEAQQVATASHVAMTNTAKVLVGARDEVVMQQKLLADQHASQTKALGELHKDELKKLSASQRQALEDQLKAFDEALGEELTKSLQSLGENLAALSKRFASDYEPLTNRLREVVRLAETLDNGRQVSA